MRPEDVVHAEGEPQTGSASGFTDAADIPGPPAGPPPLEGVDVSFMEEVSERLDQFDMFSEAQDEMAMAVFGEAVSVSLDENGRFVMPTSLAPHAGLSDHAVFVGLGKKFQIWNADALSKRKSAARQSVSEKGLTIPSQKTGGAHE